MSNHTPTSFRVDPEALILVQRNWTVYHVKWGDVQRGALLDDDLVLIQRMDQIYHMRYGDFMDGTVSLGEFDFVWANLETRDRNEFVPSWKHFHFPWNQVRGLQFTLLDDSELTETRGNARLQLEVGNPQNNWDDERPRLIYPDGTVKDFNIGYEPVLTIRTTDTDFQPGDYLLVGGFTFAKFRNSQNLKSINISPELWNMMFWWSPGTQNDKQNHHFQANGLGKQMFQYCVNFEGNIHPEGWEGFRVRNFERIFQDCTVFDQDVSGLVGPTDRNFSKNMFDGCKAFDNGGAPLNLDLTLVEEAQYMFRNCNIFNQDVSSFGFGNVTNIESMFFYAYEFDQPVGSWDVSKVVDMHNVFGWAHKFNQDLGSWNVENVTCMRFMFAVCDEFNNGGSDSIKFWDVSNVTNFSIMFSGAKKFNQPIGNWETGSHQNTEAFESMLYRAFEFDQDLTGWCVDKVTQVPPSFADQSPIENDLTKLPVWGTCP
jgi:hypothetical protein